MIRRRPTAIPSSTPCVRCRRLESTIRAVLLSVVHFTLSGFPNVLVWHLCHHILAGFWRRQSRPYERPSLQQMAKWRNLPGVVHRGLHVVVPRVQGFYEGLLFLFFCCLAHALSARCLLSSRPDTASIRSCLLLPPGFFDTREAGI